MLTEKGEMDMKKRKIIITGVVTLLFAALASNTPSAEAKKAPKLSKKNIKIEKGFRTKVSIKNASPKKVKWTVNKAGKSVVTLSSKKKKSVTVKGKKTGSATVTAKITLKGKKKKTLRAKIKVFKPGKNITVETKKQTAFPGKVTAFLDASGYVSVKWDKVAEAHAYVVQRKTGSEGWKQVKVTASRTYTDRAVKENTVYSYRVRANCDGMCTAYSSASTVKTRKIGSENDTITYPVTVPDPKPVVTPEPDSKPEEQPDQEEVKEPYKAKYSYEVKVLNQFSLYEETPIVLFVKTDNPNPNDFDNVKVSFSGGSDMYGHDYNYEDLQYQEQKETTTTFFNKVNGGWIYTVQFSSPGVKDVSIRELDKDGENNVWQIVDTFHLEIQDGEKGLQEHCNKIIKKVSNESYNEDGLGKWSTLSGKQKMERLEEYVINHMHYPRLGAETSLGYLPVWIIQENVGAFWETGFADCGAANEMMCVLARTLGYEAHRQDTTMNGGFHIVAMVTIDGEEVKYDATPWQGGYKDWDYLL